MWVSYFHYSGFTIQLATSPVKRAATAVRPPLYCTATTQASVSRVPSEFCTRSLSANSSGKLEANSTSVGVPNSMIVLSLNAPLPFARRVRRTGMRTGVALGKNLASLAVELSRAGAAAAPDLDTESLINSDSRGSSMRPGFPSPPVSVTQGTRTVSGSKYAHARPKHQNIANNSKLRFIKRIDAWFGHSVRDCLRLDVSD